MFEKKQAGSINIPSFLHDVLGEKNTWMEIVLVLLFAVLVSIFYLYSAELNRLDWWQIIIAVLLILDIAAGSISNLTRGTNDFYVERPVNRWVFIAIHIHIIILAWVLGASKSYATCVCLFTICSASLVNFELAKSYQRTLAGFLFGVGLLAMLTWPPPAYGELSIVYILFVFKVVFSFAVDHYPKLSEAPVEQQVVVVSPRYRDEFVELLSMAFSQDPLFQRLFPPADTWSKYRRRLFVSFLLDMNRIMGGEPKGIFVNGHLVAGFLLEPPQSSLMQILGSMAALLRSSPLWLQLGVWRMLLLNTYFVRTRAIMPKSRHHYLLMIGVHVSYRGHGYGKKILSHIEQEISQSDKSTGLGLDTENRNNVSLYEKFGFSLQSSELLDKELMIYSMFKKVP